MWELRHGSGPLICLQSRLKEVLKLYIVIYQASCKYYYVQLASGNYIIDDGAAEALDSGCDEAMMLDTEGFVAEGSGENFFMVKDGILYTPELTSCLNGITRATISHLRQIRD